MWMKYLTVAGALSLTALQLVPGPNRDNPRVIGDRTLYHNTAVPANVYATLQRACMDCHSNETKWPWYSYVAPMSWGMGNDVARARKAVNFSEWSAGAGKRPASAIGVLTAICADVKSERMPLKKYRLLHPEANLSGAEKEAICFWTTAESERYRQLKKKTVISQAAH